jgi:hypothetical protein
VKSTHRSGGLPKRCVRCWKPVAPENLVQGTYGPDCAKLLGLTGSTIDTGQDGPDLFDVLAETERAAR